MKKVLILITFTVIGIKSWVECAKGQHSFLSKCVSVILTPCSTTVRQVERLSVLPLYWLFLCRYTVPVWTIVYVALFLALSRQVYSPTVFRCPHTLLDNGTTVWTIVYVALFLGLSGQVYSSTVFRYPHTLTWTIVCEVEQLSVLRYFWLFPCRCTVSMSSGVLTPRWTIVQHFERLSSVLPCFCHFPDGCTIPVSSVVLTPCWTTGHWVERLSVLLSFYVSF